jgi:hypothetical protein
MKYLPRINSNGKLEIPMPTCFPNGAWCSKPMPNPTTIMLANDPIFDAIWEVIKKWDINVPEYYTGYCGGTGSHVTLIYDALMSVLPKS